MDDPRVLTPAELDAIALRAAHEPTYTSDADCRQAIRDRSNLLLHLVALESFGEMALGALAGAETLDLDEARRLVAKRQDDDAERPGDDWRNG